MLPKPPLTPHRYCRRHGARYVSRQPASAVESLLGTVQFYLILSTQWSTAILPLLTLPKICDWDYGPNQMSLGLRDEGRRWCTGRRREEWRRQGRFGRCAKRFVRSAVDFLQDSEKRSKWTYSEFIRGLLALKRKSYKGRTLLFVQQLFANNSSWKKYCPLKLKEPFYWDFFSSKLQPETYILAAQRKLRRAAGGLIQ